MKYRKVEETKIVPNEKGNYEITVVIVGKGSNDYHKIITPTTHFIKKIGRILYKIDEYHLFQIESGMFQRIKGRFKHINNRLMIFFREGESTALGLETDKTAKLSSEMLEIVESSNVLRKAMKDLFTKSLGGKKMIFFLVVGIAAVVAILVFTGNLDLGSLFK